MKKTLLILSAVTLLAVAGCSTLDKALLTQQPSITPATTNAVTGAVTPPVTNSEYVPKPAIQGAITTAQTYTPLIPAPYGTAVDTLLALAAAGLGLYARSRNGALASTAAKLQTANTIVQAVVSGVEAVGHPETKAAIQNAAVAAGVQVSLDPIVQAKIGRAHV